MEEQERNQPEAVADDREDLEVQPDDAENVTGGSGGGSTTGPKGGGAPGPGPQPI